VRLQPKIRGLITGIAEISILGIVYHSLPYGIIVLEKIPEMLMDLQLDTVVRLRKPHPCGGYEWTVTRLGADIGLECNTCHHRVMLTRRELSKRIKTIVSVPENPET
jgi:hypothetical protein